MKVVGQVKEDDNERFLNTFGEIAPTWGARQLPVFLGQVAETPIRVQAPLLAGRYFNWSARRLKKTAMAPLPMPKGRVPAGVPGFQ
jgi:hypothetical protein